MSDHSAPVDPKRYAAALSLVDGMLDKIPLVDGHNDAPFVILGDPTAKGDVGKYNLETRRQTGDTDIPRLIEGKVGTQVWAAFTESNYPHPATRTLELIDVIHQISERHPSVFKPVLRADDIAEARREGKIGSLLAVEGGVGLENSIAPLRIWHKLGVRLMTLCHNGTLDWVDSATDAPKSGGLSKFGEEVILELNRLGIMVDCAHVSPQAMRHVLKVSKAPIVISHSNASALCDNPRNVPDDVLDALAGNDGMIMATFIPDFVSEEVRKWMAPVRGLYSSVFSSAGRLEIMAKYERENGPRPRATVGQVADHLEYMVQKVGPDRVGIGSDFHGSPITTRGLEDVSRIKNLLVEMAMRGWSDDNVAKLAGLNFIRVFRAVEQTSKALGAAGNKPSGSMPRAN